MTIENNIYNDDEMFHEERSKVSGNEDVQERENKQYQTEELTSILLESIIISNNNFVKGRKR